MTDLNSEEHKEDLEKESAFSAASPQAPAAAEGEETAAAPEEVSAPSPAPAETAAAESQAKDAEKPAEKQEEAEPVKGGPAEETNAVKESDPTPKAKKKKASKRKKKEKLSIPALICAIVSFSLLYYWSACIVPRLGENINPHDKSFTQKILVLINKAKYKFGQDKTPPPAPPQNLNQQSAGSGAPPPPDGNQPPADNGAPPPPNGNQPPGPPNNGAPPPPNGNQPPGPPNNGAQPPQNGNQPTAAK